MLNEIESLPTLHGVVATAKVCKTCVSNRTRAHMAQTTKPVVEGDQPKHDHGRVCYIDGSFCILEVVSRSFMVCSPDLVGLFS